MANQGTIITVIVYNILLIGIGFLASKRNQTNDDFYIGNRGLGPWVAALSASASSSSAWTLLGVSGLAYSVGLGAVWILPGVLFGYFCQLDMGSTKTHGTEQKNRSSKSASTAFS